VKFIGRKRELEVLEEAFQSPESGFIPVYGRRRVGKSEIILQFMKQKQGIYLVGKKARARIQLREFLQEAASLFEEPLLAALPADDWKTAIQTVVEKAKPGKKLILAFDEFQWIAKASPELPSVLQELWDRYWQRKGNVLLILCGSYIGFMEREILGRESPLFGRRTAQIFLRPFSYLDAVEFLPSYSLESCARTYFVCGGIPLYLLNFKTSQSVEMNIAAVLLDEYAPLFREPDFLIREELREVENYYAVLMALAAGFVTSKDISRQTEIGERALNYYLTQLIDLGYLRRRYPLTGGRPASRHVRYELDDPLLRFWFRFVFPHMSYVAKMGSRRALRDLVLPGLDAYFGACFERLCREALPVLYRREGVASPFEVGEYWDKSTQIDVVGLREDGWIDLGECKWGRVRSQRRIESDLVEKQSRYPNPRNATICGRIFTRRETRRRDSAGSHIRWHCLRDLYEEGRRHRRA
jgi:AAA+ ATPase superfamily predicted ATPase